MVRTPTEPAAPRSLHLWHSYMPRRATVTYLGLPRRACCLPTTDREKAADWWSHAAVGPTHTAVPDRLDRSAATTNAAVVRPQQHKRTEPLGLRALVVSGAPFARMVCKRRPTRADPHRKATAGTGPGPVPTGVWVERMRKDAIALQRHFGCDLEPVGDLEQSTVVVVPTATGDARRKVQRRRTGTTRRTDVYAADADAAAQRCRLYARAMPHFPP